MKTWLLKSEPEEYSIDNLQKDKIGPWEGVRNYQARNFMRDEMKVGDRVLFYHSNSKPSGIAGVARVVREAYPDDTALNPKSKYFDPRATKENPIWVRVDVQFVKKLNRLISLDELKQDSFLKNMMVIKRGMRLSIQPVEKKHADYILSLK